MMLGAASVLLVALAWLAMHYNVTDGGEAGGHLGSVTALCAAACVASLLHAMRHRSPVCGWALWAVALAAMLAAGANVGALHWTFQACVGIGCLLAFTGPVWAYRLGDTAPTTVVWLERIEAMAAAACIPLAIHLMGIVELIRGL